MMNQVIGTKQKAEIAYLLVSFLDASRKYVSNEIDSFIANNVKPAIRQKLGYSIDHLRRAMIDNQYLSRQPDGSAYWVSTTFMGPDDQENANKQNLSKLLNNSQGEKMTCPYCKQDFSKNVILAHYQKKHSMTEYWHKRFEEYFGL